MNNIETNNYLMSDFIYIPFNNKEDIKVNNIVLKEDLITSYNTEPIYSPVSGKPYLIKKISSLSGLVNTLVIENDFLDTKKNTYQQKDIYKINKTTIKNIVKLSTNEINVNISYKYNYDITDYMILKDYTKEILELLNLLTEVYPNLKVNIIISKKDLHTYQLLFTYIGTYPTINITFTKQKDNIYTLYNIIDLYNKIKNNSIRDFIYINIVYNNLYKIYKIKKYSNLKEILTTLNIPYKTIKINDTIIKDIDFLLDDNTKNIIIK